MPSYSRVGPAVLLTLSCTLTTGCDSGGDERSWVERDSAGVHLIESTQPPTTLEESWTLSAAPLVDIAPNDSLPETLLPGIRTVFRWSDGRIGVVATRAPFLYVYAADGRLMRRLGERGQGPGEIREALWGGARGDSAVLLDRSSGRFVVFDSAGRFARSAAIATGPFTEVLASTDDGWVVAWRAADIEDHSKPATAPSQMRDWRTARVQLDGTVAETLATFPRVNTNLIQNSLWGTLRHVASDGERIHVVAPGPFAIHTYDGQRTVRIVRAPVPTLGGFTQAHIDVVHKTWGPPAERLLARDRERGWMEVPSAVAILTAPDRSLWVRRTDDGPAAKSRVWDIFDERGVWTATLRTPGAFAIHQVGADDVLGVWTNELDVPSVRTYRIQRTPTAAGAPPR